MRSKERLYWTEDKKRIVNENAREGRFLAFKVGDEIPEIIAKKYGLLDEKKEPVKELLKIDLKKENPPEASPPLKQAEQPENKMSKPSAKKADKNKKE